MRENGQVAGAAFDTVSREIRSISEESPRDPSSEHWPVTHPEINDRSPSRVSVVCASLCSALCLVALVACNVYDPSLLEHSSLGAGASDGGGSGGSGAINTAGGSAAIGGSFAYSGAGSVSQAGAGGTGASSGGTDAVAGGTSGGATGGSSAANGGAGGAGAGAGAAGGFGEIGGSGGAVNASLSMIDDMEMPDQYIPSLDGRQGFWSLSHDDSAGTQTPSIMIMSQIPGARGTSTYALHTTSTGFTKTGALVGVDLNRKTTRSTYDASAYAAVHFWAKVAAGSLTLVHFSMPDLHTDPGGGLCTKSPQLCYDHWATDRTLTTAWAEYTVAFADLTQMGWGANDVTAFDVAHVYGIQFSWGTPSMDLWIDDIAFVKK
jgi:hypothetical protein